MLGVTPNATFWLETDMAPALADVRSWPKADVAATAADVCFWGETRRRPGKPARLPFDPKRNLAGKHNSSSIGLFQNEGLAR